ncbi:MAG: hypothetical protein QOE20_1874 [Mycobacterium sp.]|jgi:hypothetical protein|nr:hypothetical protein [Mycobacterium sp.]
MAEHAASAAGLRAQASAPTAQGYWPRHRRAFCDSIARDYERKTVCR